MKETKYLSVFLLLLASLMLFTACNITNISKNSLNEFTPDEEIEFLFFYGVIKCDGNYYACVLTEYKEEPTDNELKHVRLATELSASFQPEGWVGAWKPDDYSSAKELAEAYNNGKISHGAKFSYIVESGHMTSLHEVDYYNGIPGYDN